MATGRCVVGERIPHATCLRGSALVVEVRVLTDDLDLVTAHCQCGETWRFQNHHYESLRVLGEYGCPPSCVCRRRECTQCSHQQCGWCDECHPETPEWEL